MQGRANRGMRSVVWITVATIFILLVLGALLWWYDGYWLHHH